MWKNRSKLLFATPLLIALLVWVQMGLYAAHETFGLALRFNIFDLCSSLLRAMGFDSINPLLNALVIYTLLVSLWLIAKQAYAARHAARKVQERRHEELTTWLQAKFPEDKHGLTVVNAAQPFALTLGLFRPKIVFSTGLLELLDSREVEAVYYHERHHRKHRDPLKTFTLQLVSTVMWYIPILSWCSHHYKIAREILADHEAMTVMGTPESLGSALLKLLKKPSAPAADFAYVSFADTSIHYRIHHIIDPETAVSPRLPIKLAAISLPVVLALTGVFFLSLL
ncbi:Signal transducer regulating beta-lactamase production, contains metallopeptidase domain [Paenibacillus sp. UNCCL117]|uniref:M56 family metallopeptidase n=1 Tax=unclassified Paenibacillus TaxID=185978 RepID=UPI00088F9629|nr:MULTISPECIES: M56 family metallopeptidase [unclassified Paenibacillus]SDD18941.1 Signal transducer regulating beta-lactamase production, contains metallopeptidase domain [Paenibacillus sp. cl123]SFW35362.1 Signal transducer regulating beta-lactamase production, contains metallopeptidase domain [Paenibacillus sp. UNCCL117]